MGYPKVGACGWQENLHTSAPGAPGCIFLPNLVSAIAPLPLSCSKKESAYSDRWTHKKNVTMDKQNVNTTPSMKGKGDSSSSHYRISSGLESVYWRMVSVEEKKKKKKKEKEKARYT